MIMTPALTGFGFFESFLLLKLVGLFTPLRVSIEEEEQRLDLSEHGDDAYGAG
jgi:Amt family ammonium transporter